MTSQVMWTKPKSLPWPISPATTQPPNFSDLPHQFCFSAPATMSAWHSSSILPQDLCTCSSLSLEWSSHISLLFISALFLREDLPASASEGLPQLSTYPASLLTKWASTPQQDPSLTLSPTRRWAAGGQVLLFFLCFQNLGERLIQSRCSRGVHWVCRWTEAWSGSLPTPATRGGAGDLSEGSPAELSPAWLPFSQDPKGGAGIFLTMSQNWAKELLVLRAPREGTLSTVGLSEAKFMGWPGERAHLRGTGSAPLTLRGKVWLSHPYGGGTYGRHTCPTESPNPRAGSADTCSWMRSIIRRVLGGGWKRERGEGTRLDWHLLCRVGGAGAFPRMCTSRLGKQTGPSLQMGKSRQRELILPVQDDTRWGENGAGEAEEASLIWLCVHARTRTHTHRHKLSCLVLCDPMECSQPGSSVHGIFQARILEWVAISFFRGSSGPTDRTSVSCIDRRILYHWATLGSLI